jgi:hypothetical protein
MTRGTRHWAALGWLGFIGLALALGTTRGQTNAQLPSSALTRVRGTSAPAPACTVIVYVHGRPNTERWCYGGCHGLEELKP